jgi:hypothetical protein
MKPLLTPAEVCDLLQINEQKLRKSGIPKTKLGSLTRYTVDAVEAYVAACTEEPAPDALRPSSPRRRRVSA